MKNLANEVAEAAAEEMMDNLWAEAESFVEDAFHSYEEIVRNCVRLDTNGGVQELALNEGSDIHFYTLKEDSLNQFVEQLSEIVHKNAEQMAERIERNLATQST